MDDTEIDLKGRTAKAHIDKEEQYEEKARQNATSAALLLIEIKAALPHGAYLPRLAAWGIPHSTAKRIVSEHLTPGKREQRQANDRQRKATERQSSKGPDSEPFADRTASQPTDDQRGEARHAERASPDQYRQEIIGYVQVAHQREVERLHGLLFGGGRGQPSQVAP